MAYDSTAHMAIAHNSFVMSSFDFGLLYFSQISDRSKSDIDKYHSKDYIYMNACNRESNCMHELIVPGSVSLSTSSEAVGFS